MKYGAHCYIFTSRWSDEQLPLLETARELGLDMFELSVGDDIVFDHRRTRDRAAAMGFIEARREAGEVVTGLLYLHPDAADMHDALETIDAPLNTLSDAELVPGSVALAEVNASLR